MAAVLTHLFPSATSRFMGQRTGAPKSQHAPSSGITNAEMAATSSMSENDTVESSSVTSEIPEIETPTSEEDTDQDEYEDSEREEYGATQKKHTSRQFSRKGKSRIARQLSSDDEESTSAAAKSSSDNSSEVEAQWQGSSEAEVNVGETINTTLCIFCGQDEKHDPSDDFEEYLACTVCGDNAHRQCARQAESLRGDDEGDQWRCPRCIQNGYQTDQFDGTHDIQRQRRRSSAPKIARDLLPAQSDAAKPGYHTIFGSLILDDDPMDGSRSLRKRKASEGDEDQSRPNSRKHMRRGTSEISAKQNSLENGDVFTSNDLDNSPYNLIDNKPLNIRLSRQRAQRKIEKQLVTREAGSDGNLHLIFHLSPAVLAKVDKEPQKRKRRERERARRAHALQKSFADSQEEVSHYPALQPSSFSAQMFAFLDREGEGNKSKPYGGILSEVEADTVKTFPQAVDRKKFEDARLKAEEGWKRKSQAAPINDNPRPPKTTGSASKIKCINFGGYEIDTWHDAPYPEEYSQSRVLYICEFCLKYMNSDYVAWRHKLKCPAKHPPGDEIYRDGQLSFFEVDGRKNPVYCQNLCLLAKLFLGSKTLYYDVEPFLFYIMTENDELGCHFVGYFSKEKRPSSLNNVSCILVLPIHQRRGFGHLLIDFSYLLTRVELKTGSPEKPLSDMGLVSYRSYWRLVLCYQLVNQRDNLSIMDISDKTGMTTDDIVCALEGLRALVRDPVTKQYALRLDYKFFREYVARYEDKGYTKLNPDALIWVPYVMGRDNMHYENAAPLHTVAQRDEDQGLISPDEGLQQLEAKDTESTDQANSQDADLMSPGVSTPQNGEFEKPTGNVETSSGPIANSDTEIQISTPTKPIADTPWVQGSSQYSSPIPATRFEVFPPIRGSATRKRHHRSIIRGTNRRGTLARRKLSYGSTPVGTANQSGPPTARRTRSKLADSVNGVEVGRADVLAADQSALDPDTDHNGIADEEVQAQLNMDQAATDERPS